MVNRADDAEDDRLAEQLISFHEQLVEGETPVRPTDTPIADESRRLARLQACLVDLEKVRMAGEIPALFDFAAAPAFVRSNEGGIPRIGRFKIFDRLGSGGQGVVYLAHDPVLDRRVALKVPRPETLVTPELRRRFLKEARAAARITHQNLASVFEAGEVGPLCFITSAYCAGPNLGEWLRERRQPVDCREAVNLVAEIADAVEFVHRAGMLHRDIKPTNILLDPRGEQSDERSLEGFAPKLTDFGLARLTESDASRTREGAMLGTPSYMAPEQARGESAMVGPATDVYGLGAVLFELLSGTRLFAGESDAETLRQVLDVDAPEVRRFRPEAPADLAAICRKCLEKKPALRYASASGLADDLRRFLAGLPTLARPLSAGQKLARWADRNRSLAAALAVVAALLVGMAGVSTFAAFRIDAARQAAEMTAVRETAAKEEAERLRVLSEQRLRELESRDRRSWRSLYASNMRSAFEYLANGSMHHLEALLEQSRPGPGREDLRSFEWYFLWREVHRRPGRVELTTEGGPCFFVFYSPDNKFLLAGTEKGIVHVWDANTLAPVYRWQAHGKCINGMRFSPDGQTLATTSCDRTVRFWRTSDWQPTGPTLHHTQPQFRCVFSTDGKLLITATTVRNLPPKTKSAISVWDVKTGEQLHDYALSLGTIYDLEWALDQTRLVAIDAQSVVHQWRLVGDELVPIVNDLGQRGRVDLAGLALTSDTAKAFYTSRRGGVEIADLATGSRQSWYRSDLLPTRLAVSLDGQKCAVATQTMAWIRHPSDGVIVEPLPGLLNVHQLCFSPDDLQLVSASHDGHVRVTTLNHPMQSGVVRQVPRGDLWADGTQRVLRRGDAIWVKWMYQLGFISPVTGEFTGRFSSPDAGNVLDWDITLNELTAVVSTLEHGASRYYLLLREPDSDAAKGVAEFGSEVAPRFDRSGARLAGFSNQELWIRDARSGEIIKKVSADPTLKVKTKDAPLIAVRWIDGGRSVIVPFETALLKCDLETGRWTNLGPTTQSFRCLDKGKFVFKNSAPGKVTVVDGAAGSRVSEIDYPGFEHWDLTLDERRMACPNGDGVRLYDVATGESLGTIPFDGGCDTAYLSEDGQVLVAVGKPDANGNCSVTRFLAAMPEEVAEAEELGSVR